MQTTIATARRLSTIPRIAPEHIRPNDVKVWCSEAISPMMYVWCEVLHRPSTGELFRIRCYDGEKSSYFPDVIDGALPEGLDIDDDLRIHWAY